MSPSGIFVVSGAVDASRVGGVVLTNQEDS
jgi:hypothetical protein